MVKQSTGNEDNREEQKAEGLQSGISQGAKGFGKEIVSGVTGIFTKPVEGAKKKGLFGFVKGVGSGIVGAVSSPVTGLLRGT